MYSIYSLYFSHTHEKGLNLTILSQAMSKQEDKLRSFILVWQPASEKDNSLFRPIKFCLKIDLVSHPARAQELGKYKCMCIAKLRP